MTCSHFLGFFQRKKGFLQVTIVAITNQADSIRKKVAWSLYSFTANCVDFQLAFDYNLYKSLMIICVAASFVGNGMCTVVQKMQFVMIRSGRLAVSLMFLLISAGGLVITYLVSRFIYKEKLTKIQFIGFVLGLSAVVFLNI